MVNKDRSAKIEEIDIRDLFKSFWKDKIIYLSIIFFFTFSSFLYSLTINKNLEINSSITVKEPSAEFFSNFKPFLNDIRIDFSEDQFTSNFHKNILSMDNVKKFVDQNMEISELKVFLETNQFKVKEYFRFRLFRTTVKRDKKTIDTNIYTLSYPEFFDGNKFLNDYVTFSMNETINDFRQNKKIQIKNHILLLKQNLEIAKIISLENPIILDYEENSQSYVLGDPIDVYYQGTKVLNKRIEHLEELVKTFDKPLSYIPVLDSASIVSSNAKSLIRYPIIGLIAGLFFSFLIILIRSFKK